MILNIVVHQFNAMGIVHEAMFALLHYGIPRTPWFFGVSPTRCTQNSTLKIPSHCIFSVVYVVKCFQDFVLLECPSKFLLLMPQKNKEK